MLENARMTQKGTPRLGRVASARQTFCNLVEDDRLTRTTSTRRTTCRKKQRQLLAVLYLIT